MGALHQEGFVCTSTPTNQAFATREVSPVSSLQHIFHSADLISNKLFTVTSSVTFITESSLASMSSSSSASVSVTSLAHKHPPWTSPLHPPHPGACLSMTEVYSTVGPAWLLGCSAFSSSPDGVFLKFSYRII